LKIGLQTWGSEGDVQPFIALAAGLTRARHEVTLMVTDVTLRDHSAVAQKLGFSLLSIGSRDLPSPETSIAVLRELFSTHNLIRQTKTILNQWFEPVAKALFEASQVLCRSNDLVVGHMVLDPLRVAAEAANLPLVTIAPAAYAIPSAFTCPYGAPDLGRWANPVWWKLARSVLNRIFLSRVNALRVQQGLAPDHDVLTQTWTSQWLNLVAVSPVLCERPRDWGAHHQVCGFLNLPLEHRVEEVAPGLEEFMQAGEPPVYFTFGSMMPPDLEYLREVARIWFSAVRRVGCRGIFQLPWNDPRAFEQDERVFNVQRVPHGAVFPKCAMVVHHGGAGTTQSSLLAGRPAVVVAHVGDQFYWGSELQKLGVAGRSLERRGLSAAGLARSILQVRNSPGVAERAIVLGRAMAAEDGIKAAVAAIEARMARS
jgi:sterol 3beta-glucosyltransferase